MSQDRPELLLIVCEGATEVEYFNILKRQFRLPTWIKVIPDRGDHRTLGQHERLIKVANSRRSIYADELEVNRNDIETWAVCDRDDYRGSFIELRDFAKLNDIELAFSDPQFENYLLQHFSANKSKGRGFKVIQELSAQLPNGMYRKSDLSWLDEMIGGKHAIVRNAIANATIFSKHTEQPFFTVQKLVRRVLGFEGG